MTVKEFVKQYEKITNEDQKETLVKSIMTGKYLPYEEKVTACERVIKNTYHVKAKDQNGKEYEKLFVNSPAKYMMYCLMVVDKYTTLDVQFKNCVEEFNLLNRSECIDYIISEVSDREISEFRMVLDMVESDVMQNEYETHAYISSQVERFGNLAGATLSPLLKTLINSVDNMDAATIDKLQKSLDKLSKLSK